LALRGVQTPQDEEEYQLQTPIEAKPGLATGSHVYTFRSAGADRSVLVEVISNRHEVKSWDFQRAASVSFKVKGREEHHGQRIVEVLYRLDSRVAAGDPAAQVIHVSESQEILAADSRGAEPRWIAAEDLLAGKHVLMAESLATPWAEIVSIAPPRRELYRTLSVHELTLLGGDSYSTNDLILRARSAPVPAPVTKRVVLPLKDLPQIGFVPQPKSLISSEADYWFRMSASFIPKCVDQSLAPRERVEAALAIKARLLEVAGKSLVGQSYKSEFMSRLSLPNIDALLPNFEQLSPELQEARAQEVIQQLSLPGEHKNHATAGGDGSSQISMLDGASVRFESGAWVRYPRA
jgi:hypothetical protein